MVVPDDADNWAAASVRLTRPWDGGVRALLRSLSDTPSICATAASRVSLVRKLLRSVPAWYVPEGEALAPRWLVSAGAVEPAFWAGALFAAVSVVNDTAADWRRCRMNSGPPCNEDAHDNERCGEDAQVAGVYKKS